MKNSRFLRRGHNFIRHLKNRMRLSRRSFILYSILRALVILVLVRSILEREYENVALCILSLVLFLMPALAEEELKIEIPPLFEALIYLFIYAAEILGEINHYYVLIPGWDTMLHTINGFLCAAIGFSMVDLLNRHSTRFNLSPFFLSMVAFCFSMTIGVLWEFFEFAMDQLFFLDMQKDFIVKSFGSVTLDPDGLGNPVRVSKIAKTVISTATGKTYTITDGYLDIGIIDTMKDLFVNFIGAVVFSVIGYFYVTHRSKKSIASELLIRRESPEEAKRVEQEIREHERQANADRQKLLRRLESRSGHSTRPYEEKPSSPGPEQTRKDPERAGDQPEDRLTRIDAPDKKDGQDTTRAH